MRLAHCVRPSHCYEAPRQYFALASDWQAYEYTGVVHGCDWMQLPRFRCRYLHDYDAKRSTFAAHRRATRTGTRWSFCCHIRPVGRRAHERRPEFMELRTWHGGVPSDRWNRSSQWHRARDECARGYSGGACRSDDRASGDPQCYDRGHSLATSGAAGRQRFIVAGDALAPRPTVAVDAAKRSSMEKRAAPSTGSCRIHWHLWSRCSLTGRRCRRG